MKKAFYFIFSLVVITACKTSKTMIDSNAVAKEMSAKKVAKKHIAANFDKKSLDAKMKVGFDNGKMNQSLTVNMKIIKDEVIWLKGTKFISVFKAKITPTSVSYYSPLARHYFTGDFSLIKKLLGVEINFEQLQNLFLGQSLFDVKKRDQKVEIVNNTYVLSPEEQDILYNIFFVINPAHFKLDSQFIANEAKNLRLDVNYPSYKLMDNVVFPSEINIKAKKENAITDINIQYKSVEFNTALDLDFEIPSGYKRLEL